LNLFLKDSAQWLGFRGETVCIAGPCKVIQPLVE
jgi:hypothetical protein